MGWAVVATIDANAAAVIREALEDAGIPMREVGLRPFGQLEYLRHQQRARIDVEVEENRADEARAVLARLSLESQAAAAAQAGGDGSLRSDEDRRIEQERVAGTRRAAQAAPPARRSPLVAFVLALLVPVAGSFYARARVPIAVSLVGHVAGLALLWAGREPGRDDMPLVLVFGGLLFAVTRLLDMIVSPVIVAMSNATTPPEEIHGPRS